MLLRIMMILFVSCSTLASQILVKRSIMEIAANDPLLHGVSWLIKVLFSPPVMLAILIQGIGFSVWLFVVDRMKLGLAFSISGATFYMLLAFVGWYLYGERLAATQWIGIGMISIGILLMSINGGGT